ncbi:MAG: hypothetical protein HY741_00235 [Chloroflexi bacterium]|nr:hypothetical protein [Chloroflexota bacterium]
MLNGSRRTFLLLGAFLIACGFVGVLGMWYVQSGDTTQVLAAFVEQTPTPSAPSTPPPRNQDQAAQQIKRLAQQLKLAAAFGTIQRIQGNGLTIQTAQAQTRTFETDAQTRYIVVGKKDATLSDLQVGAKDSSNNNLSSLPLKCPKNRHCKRFHAGFLWKSAQLIYGRVLRSWFWERAIVHNLLTPLRRV